MYMLQLFDRDDMLQPRDARLLREGSLKIGRDAGSDWPIPDPECALSRLHCEVTATGDFLTLRALGANGVFDDDTGERYPDAADVELALPSALRLGRFRIVASRAPIDDSVIDTGLTMLLTPPLGASAEVPSEWSDGPAADAGETPVSGEGSLLEAFCQGAGIDCSQLTEEDPTEIMRRAGAVYRQMVLGIGDLMSERDRARNRYQLTRTTISGSDNNPFKWAPTQRLAIDLLLTRSAGFLSGAAALKASFRDVKRHLVASFAGLQASLQTAVDTFDPAAIDGAAGARSALLKSRATLAMGEVADRHADLTRQLSEAAPGSLDAAFVRAYDAAEASMGRMTPVRIGDFFRARPERGAPLPPLMQSSVARSHVGRVRTVNEDRMLELPDRGLWAVADGMGGHSGGDVAAGIVIDELALAAAAGVATDDHRIVAALHHAHRKIIARPGAADASSGTTVVVAHVRDARATIWWVGDSRAYRVRRGRAECLTRDHSLVQELVDSGVLSELQAERHPQRNVITRAVGIGDALRIDKVETDLQPGDLLMLCSDGISRSLMTDDFLSQYVRLDDLADTLLRQSLERDGSDNATLVLVQTTRDSLPDELKRTIQ